MQTLICRFLAIVFFLQCLPLPTEATPAARSSKRKRNLDRQVETRVQEQYPYNAWQAEIKELEAVLGETDLSDDERKFAELELEIAKTRVEHIDAFDNSKKTVAGTNAIYAARLNVLEVQENDLEKQIQLRNLYQTVQSQKLIAACVYALHNHAIQSGQRYQQASANLAQTERKYQTREEYLAQLEERQRALSRDQFVQQPVSTRVATLPQIEPLQVSNTFNESATLLQRWADNNISIEELIEYADPVTGNVSGESPSASIAAAAELLFYVFYGYNMPNAEFTEETLANTLWAAKRIKYRAMYQLHRLEQISDANETASLNFIQARGNLMRLLGQTISFLKKHDTNSDESSLEAFDKQLEDYPALQSVLDGYHAGIYSYSSVAQAITQDVKRAYNQSPKADSKDSVFLTRNLSYVTGYLISTENIGLLAELIVLVDQDKENFHGKNELYVSAIFGSIFEAMINFPTSDKTQQTVRQLLLCAAAPECEYGNQQKTNAVNVRAQALAVASMLRQAAAPAQTYYNSLQAPNLQPADNTTKSEYISKTVFEDVAFRTKMANFTIDLYAPAQEWNIGPVQTYGLVEKDETNGLPAFSNHLAKIFDSFLPVNEPKTKRVPVKSGIYEGCLQLEIVRDAHGKIVWEPLNSLNKSTSGSLHITTSNQGYPCSEISNPNVRGDIYNPIVVDSRGNLQGISYFNYKNYKRLQKALGEKIMFEVATWYLWGAAFKGLGYLWKGAKAALWASEAAAKASNGFKLARFNSKFSQVWKLSTKGWQTEMGLVKVAKNGDKIFVEIARPGYQGRMFNISKEALGGHSLKSLKGRILLRRSVQRELLENNANRFLNPLTKTEQRIVRSEQAAVSSVERDLSTLSSEFTESQVALYQPANKPDLWIDFSTGLPEKVRIDPLTGNITSEISHQYMGTLITPYTQNPVSYNIAAGLVTAPSPQLTGRIIWNQFPVLQQLNGLTKFVAGMMALDNPVYHWYVKPYMEDVARRHDKILSEETGYKPQEDSDQDAVSQTVLDGIQQGLNSTVDDTTAATLQGVFFGSNQLLNYLLPSSIQNARRWLFKKTFDLSSDIDDPISEKLGAGNTKLNEFLPLPGQVLSFPFIMASDPTPATPSDAARAQYQLAARQQEIGRAMEQHNITRFKQQADQELESLESGLPLFLSNNEDLLKADPKARKEIKKAYKTYEQLLKQAKKLADKDLAKAEEKFAAATEKFTNTQADIMTRAIHAYASQLRHDLPQIIAQYRETFQDLFTPQKEAELTALYTRYYNQQEADLINFYTVFQRALQSNQNPQTMQDEIQEQIRQHNLAFVVQLNQFGENLNQRISLLNAISEEWRRDFAAMYPAYTYYLPLEAQNQLNKIIEEFQSQLQEANSSVLDNAALQARYQQLVIARNAQFESFKRYWIAQNPLYEQLFNATLSSQQATPAP